MIYHHTRLFQTQTFTFTGLTPLFGIVIHLKLDFLSPIHGHLQISLVDHDRSFRVVRYSRMF
jgi:hypothetical protein